MKISHKIKFIDSFGFMSSSLSNLVDNLSEGLHSDKCPNCKSCLDYMITKDDQLIFRSFECNMNYKKDFNNELIKRFANMLRYFNFEPSLKLQWFRARDLFGPQIPVTTGGFELRISCIESRYLTH